MKEQRDEALTVLKAYEALAERYATLVDSKAENAYVKRSAMLSLLPNVEGRHVLDVGCGPGWCSEWLVEHGARVVAIDVSPKMVELAKRRLGARVEVHRADLSEPLDFLGDASFELILYPLVLDYIRNGGGVFIEFCRLLRLVGLLIFSVEHPFTKFLLHGGGDYFATELVEVGWRGLEKQCGCHLIGGHWER